MVPECSTGKIFQTSLKKNDMMGHEKSDMRFSVGVLTRSLCKNVKEVYNSVLKLKKKTRVEYMKMWSCWK